MDEGASRADTRTGSAELWLFEILAISQPLIPAQAGISSGIKIHPSALDPRLRGDERIDCC